MDTKALGVVVDRHSTDTPHSNPSANGEAEVFQSENGVNFRTVGWVRASMFCIKLTFATGVLSIPGFLYTLGAVAGTMFIVFWCLLNTYLGAVQGHFKSTHPSMHAITDAAYLAALDVGFSSESRSSQENAQTSVMWPPGS